MDTQDSGQPYHVINNTNLHIKAGGYKRKTALSPVCTIYGTTRKITAIHIGYYLR